MMSNMTKNILPMPNIHVCIYINIFKNDFKWNILDKNILDKSPHQHCGQITGASQLQVISHDVKCMVKQNDCFDTEH